MYIYIYIHTYIYIDISLNRLIDRYRTDGVPCARIVRQVENFEPIIMPA